MSEVCSHTKTMALGCFIALTCMLSAVSHAQPITLEGFSKPARISKLGVASSGIVQQFWVEEGDLVQKGQVLVSLDTRVHQTFINMAKSGMEADGELKAAQAEFNHQSRRLNAIRKLIKGGHATPEELLQAETRFDVATANLKTALETREMRRLEYHKLLAQYDGFIVRAPFDGVITKFHKEVGEYVGAVDPGVCTIVKLNALVIDFLVPRSQLGSLKRKQKTKVLFTESDREAVGTVHYLSPYADGETNTYTVRIKIDNTDQKFSAGERCRLIGPLKNSNAPALSIGKISLGTP